MTRTTKEYQDLLEAEAPLLRRIVRAVLLAGVAGVLMGALMWTLPSTTTPASMWPDDECPRGVFGSVVVQGMGPMTRACVVGVNNVARWQWVEASTRAQGIEHTDSVRLGWGVDGRVVEVKP